MGLGALRVFGGLADGANSGIANLIAIKRQKALDEVARKRADEDAILRRKAEERLSERQQWERDDRVRAQTEREQTNQDKVRQQQIADFNEPFDAFDKDAEVAAATAPFRSRARSIARDYVKAPDQNDPGIGVLAAENPERQGMQWGKGALQGAYDTQVEGAQKTAGDIFSQRAANVAEKMDIDRDKANRPPNPPMARPDPRVTERVEKSFANFSRMKSDIDLINQAVDAGDDTGFTFSDSMLSKFGVAGRAIMSEQAVRNRSALDNIFNSLLSEQSGLNVTEQESMRQAKARLMGSTSASDFKIGWQRFLGTLNDILANKRAAFPPEALDTFRSRGGNVDLNVGGEVPADPDLDLGVTERLPKGPVTAPLKWKRRPGLTINGVPVPQGARVVP